MRPSAADGITLAPPRTNPPAHQAAAASNRDLHFFHFAFFIPHSSCRSSPARRSTAHGPAKLGCLVSHLTRCLGRDVAWGRTGLERQECGGRAARKAQNYNADYVLNHPIKNRPIKSAPSVPRPQGSGGITHNLHSVVIFTQHPNAHHDTRSNSIHAPNPAFCPRAKGTQNARNPIRALSRQTAIAL